MRRPVCPQCSRPLPADSAPSRVWCSAPCLQASYRARVMAEARAFRRLAHLVPRGGLPGLGGPPRVA